jgi:DNA-binding protein H-NS
MARINLSGMDVESLFALRDQVDARLREHKASLEKQLGRISGGDVGRKSMLRGKKVAPKYRSTKDPSLTWAGRGATPLWMREEMKGGKLKKEAFAIK